MSLLVNQSHIAPGSSAYAGDKVYASLAQIDISNITAIPNASVDTVIGTLSSTYYPVVGKTYMITLGFTFDITFGGTPAGIVNLGLGYYNGSSFVLSAKAGNYCASSTTAADVYGTVSFVFTHTSSTNSVKLIATNLSGQTINNTSDILITSMSSVEMASDAGNISGTPFA